MLRAISRAPASSPLAEDGAGASAGDESGAASAGDDSGGAVADDSGGAAAAKSSSGGSAAAPSSPACPCSCARRLVESAGARAQLLELALELVEPVEHRAGRALDAADVVGRLSRGVGPQVGGARLGRLEDHAHLLGRARRQRARPRAPAQRLELVGDTAQVLVDCHLVVAAPADREIAALDGVSVHALRIVARRAHDTAHR